VSGFERYEKDDRGRSKVLILYESSRVRKERETHFAHAKKNTVSVQEGGTTREEGGSLQHLASETLRWFESRKRGRVDVGSTKNP